MLKEGDFLSAGLTEYRLVLSHFSPSQLEIFKMAESAHPLPSTGARPKVILPPAILPPAILPPASNDIRYKSKTAIIHTVSKWKPKHLVTPPIKRLAVPSSKPAATPPRIGKREMTRRLNEGIWSGDPLKVYPAGFEKEKILRRMELQVGSTPKMFTKH